MRNSRKPEVPVNDYDLDSLKKITFRGLNYYIMPRYLEHYVTHDYEPFTLDLFLCDVTSDSTVVDIGAHFGAYSLLAACKVVNGSVHAFEPVPETRSVLNKNVKNNNLEHKVVIHEEALSDHVGVSSLNIPWASDSASFHEHPNAETIRRIDVTTATLDSLFASERVDVIKIDAEGHEIRVLRGAQELCRRNPTVKLYVEFNPKCLRSAGHSPADLLTELHRRGYKTYIVDDNVRQLTRVDNAQNWHMVIEPEAYANLYCVPKLSSSGALSRYARHVMEPHASEATE